VAKLKHTFKTDTLFKILFVKYPHLLKKLVAVLLGIEHEDIQQFEIINSEIPAEALSKKFCRLDVNMNVDGQKVVLEIQVEDEGDFPERTLYQWAREYSMTLAEGEQYCQLPQVVHISIVNFSMFDCQEFHSEFKPLEVTRHTLLTDKMSLHYFELPKLCTPVGADNPLELWLALFKANTEEDLKRIEALEVPDMKEAIDAYRITTASPELRELERLISKAGHDEAQALYCAEKRGEERGEKRGEVKWQRVIAEKDAEIAELRARLGENK